MRKILENVPVTETFRFMLPFLELPYNILNKYCVNAYYADTSNPDAKEHLFLLFEFFNDPVQEQIHNSLSTNPNYISDYKPTETLIMYCYKVPNKHLRDFEMFKRSKYSQISDEGKTQIRKWHSLTPNKDLYGIIYKTPAKKQALENKLAVVMSDGSIKSEVILAEDAEYLDVLDPERETFDLANYILKTQ